MRLPRNQRLYLLVSSVIVFGALSSALLCAHLSLKRVMCEDDDAKDLMVELCYDYLHTLLTGDLCHDLCRTLTIQYKSCLNRKRGKHVFLVEWKGMQLIFKSKFSEINDILPVTLITNDEPAAHGMRGLMKIFGGSPYFNSDIPEVKKIREVNNGRGSGVIDLMNKAISERQKMAAENTLWSLLQQEEYVMLRYLQGNVNVPKLYGSCGHFYLVENNPPWQDRDVWTWLGMPRNSGWSTRASIALQILDIVKVMQYKLDEQLQMCDVKIQNFGLDNGGIVKLIDVDQVVFDSSFRLKVGAVRRCTRHRDCDQNDCKGWCQFESGKCYSGGRINNNLQSVCQKIFMADWTNDLTGLLRSPPDSISAELQEILKRCSNPAPTATDLPGCTTGSRGEVSCQIDEGEELVRWHRRFTASDEDLNKLYNLLEGDVPPTHTAR